MLIYVFLSTLTGTMRSSLLKAPCGNKMESTLMPLISTSNSALRTALIHPCSLAHGRRYIAMHVCYSWSLYVFNDDIYSLSRLLTWPRNLCPSAA